MNSNTSYTHTDSDSNSNLAAQAYLASLKYLLALHPEIARAMVQEFEDQSNRLKLIASENYCSYAVQLSMGNWLTDKYAEGIANHRFYAGCRNVDAIEQLGAEMAQKLFGAEYAYLQPHSGADANLIAFWAILCQRVESPALQALGKKNPDELSPTQWNEVRLTFSKQRLLGLSLNSGGHLTHGFRHNCSGKMFEAYSYDVDPVTRQLDYEKLEQQALEVKPLILLAGYSAYPRKLDFQRLRAIADRVGAVLMVDMAHFAGLVAGKAFTGIYNPVPYADIITTTTHKTLRGPRGGMILSKKELQPFIEKGCPLVMGGPLPHVMAAKAIAFKEALEEEFQTYAAQIIENAQLLGDALIKEGIVLSSGGTENHLLLLDLQASNLSLNGRQAEKILDSIGISTNRNALPFDPNGPWYTSGIRIGTPAITTRGLQGAEIMGEIARIIATALKNATPKMTSAGVPSKSEADFSEELRLSLIQEVQKLLQSYPLYPELKELLTLIP
jgi:glycine hydroxymethyltransferase